jgi:hypothetical protein
LLRRRCLLLLPQTSLHRRCLLLLLRACRCWVCLPVLGVP